MADLAKLVVKLEAESSKLHKELERANRKFDRFGKKASAAAKKLRTVFGAAAGLAGIKLIADAMDNMVERVGEAAGRLDDLGKTSRRLGLTAEQLQRIRIQAEAAGVKTEVLDTAFQRFARRIGSGDLDKTFRDLNITLRDSEGHLKSNYKLWQEFGKKISSLEDGNQQLALAMKAVDTEGVKLVGLWRSSPEQIEAINGKIEKYGLLFHNGWIKTAEQYQTEIGLVRRAHEAVDTKISLALQDQARKWEVIKYNISKAALGVLKYFGAFDHENNLLRLERAQREISARLSDPKYLNERKRQLEEEYQRLQQEQKTLEDALHRAKQDWLRKGYEDQLKRSRQYMERIRQQLENTVKAIDALSNAEGSRPNIDMSNVTGSVHLATEQVKDDMDRMLDEVSSQFEDLDRQWVLKQVGLIDKIRIGYNAVGKAAQDAAESVREALDPDGYAQLDAISSQFEDLNRQWNLKQAGLVDKIVIGTSRVEQAGQEAARTWTELGGVMSSAFERAIVEGDKLSDVLKGLERDLMRVLIRTTITDPFSKAVSAIGKNAGDWLGKVFSGLSGGGSASHRAAGGPVEGGVAYVVGERGPELFVPGMNGSIVPNHALVGGGRGGDVVVNVVEAPGKGGQVVQRDDGGNRIIEVLVESIKGSLARDITTGGNSVAGALERTYGLSRAAGAY